MADFDTDVALKAQGYNPADAVAPLQAYMLAQQGRNLDTDNQLAQVKLQEDQARFGAQQSFAKTLADPNANKLAGLNSSGLGAYDPASEQTALANLQSKNSLNALSNYSANPSNPNALAPIGPAAVAQGQGALGDAQDVEAKKAAIRGQIGAGYLQNKTDLGWHTAVAQAQGAGLIHDLQALHAIENIRDPNQREGIARQWAASGTSSAETSGIATGARAAAGFPYDHFSAPATDTVHMGTAWRDGPPPPGGFADPTRISGGAPPPAPVSNTGRSVATDPNDPAQMKQMPGGTAPPMMTQAEKQFGLPTNYLTRTAQIESGGRANASNPSGATGLFQFMPGTWSRYADPGTSALDPQASTVAAARLAADNQKTLTQSLGRQPTGAELYLAHQQGATGAAALLNNPNASAASIVGAKAVISNGGTPNMTAGAFASMWERKFNGAGNSGNFSLSGPSPMGSGATMPPAEAPSSLPGTGGAGLRAAAANAPQTPTQPDLAPPVGGPVSLPSSTQPMPLSADATIGRSASEQVPPTAPLTRPNPNAPITERGLTPFQLEKQHLDAARAVDEERTARDQFVSANDAQRGLLQLEEDLSKLTPGPNANLRDTLLAPGSGADTRIGLAKAINSALATVGGKPIFDPDKITAAESAAKTSGRLGFDLAGGLGGGSKAGFIVNEAIGLNPSVMNTPQGGKLLIGSLLATQQRQKDLYLFQSEYARNNGGNPIGAEIEFDQSHSPMRYVEDAQRLARVPMQAQKFLQAHPDQGTISAFNQKYGPSLARYYLGSRTD